MLLEASAEEKPIEVCDKLIDSENNELLQVRYTGAGGKLRLYIVTAITFFKMEFEWISYHAYTYTKPVRYKL